MNAAETGGGASVENKLLVTETFYSIQGEGRSMGKPSYFIRFFGCNYSCAWCDSRHSWAAESRGNAKWMTPEEIVEKINVSSNVVLTGGEPTLWMGKPGWTRLLNLLGEKRCFIEIETNGSNPPDLETLDRVGQWNVSPKLHSAGEKESNEKGIVNLFYFMERVRSKTNFNWQLKFVISNEKDLERMNYILERLQSAWQLTPDLIRKHVYVMPEAQTREDHLQRQSWLIQKVLEDGRVNYCPRLHILEWNNKRGV